MTSLSINDVLHFWFLETTTAQKWIATDEFDRLIIDKFGRLLEKASNNELSSWRNSARGALAEIIVLDQFSRHIHRGSMAAFAMDKMSLRLSKQAINRGFDEIIPIPFLSFLYMPFMHSESLEIHQEAADLFRTVGLEETYKYELKHMAILQRFGRYPHRNNILQRTSTREELVFLTEPGSSF
jgi:uncharacterized protein (DUF924 family)